MARVYKVRKNTTPIEYIDTPKNSVDNSVDETIKEPVDNPTIDTSEINTYTSENVDNPTDTVDIVLDSVPSFEETTEVYYSVEKTNILDPIKDLITLPDRWHIKLPEDNNYVPLLNFYKDDIIIASLPINDENLNGLMPILDTFYTRPDAEPTLPLWTRMKRWMKNHKFSTGVIILVGLVVTLSLVSAALTGLGVGVIQ